MTASNSQQLVVSHFELCQTDHQHKISFSAHYASRYLRGNTATMTPDEIRAARGLMNISVEELSAEISISLDRITNFESGNSMDSTDHSKIITYFQDHGIKFLSDGIGYGNSKTFHGVSMFFMKSVAKHINAMKSKNHE